MFLESKANNRVTPLKKILNKDPQHFQREDLLQIIEKYQIRQINLHYTGIDEKLKELKIPISSIDYADLILAQGERLDGSSIFKGLVSTTSSDLYIVPIYKTAFISPFEENTMGILCRFMDKNGNPAPYTPDNILLQAHNDLMEKTGYSLNALGELEFYIMFDSKDSLFKGNEQNGYHQSAPFVKSAAMVNEMTTIIEGLTGAVKYCHSEVGYIHALKSMDEEFDGKTCEQFEIEFLPRPIDEMGYYLNLAKWIVRNVAYKWGASVTFAPKLEEGMAGNGLHIHMELLKDGKNIMTNKDGSLSDLAKKLIGGLLKHSSSITAFGNSVSSAYLRLVSNQEAPTKICWSEHNRSALIRVPLGWSNIGDMAQKVNPNQRNLFNSHFGSRQTVELRSPDGSAHTVLLLAAITLAVEDGLLDPSSLELAEKLHVSASDLNNQEYWKSLRSLPASCEDSAQALINNREFFECNNIFSPQLIEYISTHLKNENDKNINERFSHFPADKRLKATRAIMHKDLHKH